MRISLITLCFLFSASAQANEWISLFDGKTTQGWRPNADEGAFRVEDGAMRLQATHPDNRGHLFYVGDDSEPELFKNFELEVVAKGEPNSNSGIVESLM